MNKSYPEKEGIELFRQRARNLLDATNFIEPDKVPVGLDYLNWPYGYAGGTLAEVIDDPKANADAYCKFMDDIEFDFTMNAGEYLPYDAYQALGSSSYVLCADGCTVQHNQVNHSFITDEEYDILIKDFPYFSNEYFIKRNVPAFREPVEKAYEMLKKAAICIDRNNQASALFVKKALEHQILPLVNMGGQTYDPAYGMRPYAPAYFAPLDTIFDRYRGMENVFCDLMEDPEILDKACEAIQKAAFIPPFPTDEFNEKPFPFGFAIYHSAAYLSPEQYDKYWFQGFKKAMLPLAEKGLKIYLKGEGAFLHTIERFKEFPRGSVVIQLDLDDPIEAHKRIGGHQPLATGLKTTMLMPGIYDKQKCTDHIKKVFDALAPGGGFLFYQNVPLLSPSDAEPATVRDVWEFVNEYAKGGKYHG